MKTLIAIVDGCGNITFRNPDAEYVDVLKEDDGLWHIADAWPGAGPNKPSPCTGVPACACIGGKGCLGR